MKHLLTIVLFSYFVGNLTAQIDLGPVTLWDGEGHLDDVAGAVEKDANGNIYVLGTTIGAYSEYDIVLIKYNSSGVKVWQAVWDDPGQEIDQARGMYVDSAGNTYITGNTRYYTSVTYYNIVTLKYDPNGNLLWSYIYNGTADNDYANDITVDQNGNVYVVGDSREGPSGNRDYITLKFNTSGSLLWDRFYNGPGNSLDYARAVTVNQAGDVFVTGESRNAALNYDMTTVKYNAAGVQQWVHEYHSGGSNADFGRDILTAPDGFIYASGSSNNKLICIKYNPTTGIPVWQSILSSSTNDAAFRIKYSAADTTIVLGGSQGYSGNFLTTKMSTGGSFLWQAYYDSGNAYDNLGSVEVDDLGNVYTGGRSSLPGTPNYYEAKLIKYDPAGNQLWITSYSNGYSDGVADICIQDNGELAVSQFSAFNNEYNIHTARYSTSGNEIWRDIFEGEGLSDDHGAKMILDGDFNQIIIGSTNGYGYNGTGSEDYALIKMDSLGNELWYSIYKHPGDGSDEPVDLVVDANNNIYVTGYTSNAPSGGTYDITTVKYNSMGDTIWTRTYDGPGGVDDTPCAIALDSLGNLFVSGTTGTGTFFGNSSSDIVLLKYDINGNFLGNFFFTNPAFNGFDEAHNMAIDPFNNVYVVGATHQTAATFGAYDYVTIKFDNNGTLLWDDIHVAPAKGYANKILINDNNDVYVGGIAENKTSMDLLKYDSAGNQLWVFNEPTADSLADMILSSSGDIYLTAMKRVSIGKDIVTLKVSENGQLLWLQAYNHAAGSDDMPYGMGLDPSENVIVVGTQEHLYTTNYQALLLQYDSTGGFLVQRTYESLTTYGKDKFTDVECLASGRVLVTGQAYEVNIYNAINSTDRHDIMAANFTEANPNPRLKKVNPANNEITIRNFGSTQVNLSNYKLASESNQINLISSMTVVQGSLIVPPLGEVVLSGLSLDLTGGDLTLYQPAADFNNTADMVDFMQWKNAGNPWQNTAVNNNYWASNTFVDGEPTYIYIGNGDDYGVQYWEGFHANITAQTNAQCASNCVGSATLTISGGEPPYAILWDSNAGNQTTTTATSLCSGIYTVTVTDSENNQITNVASIGDNFSLTFNPEILNENCNSADGSIVIHPDGGTAAYSFAWNISGADSIQTNLSAGTYIATVTDANNCMWDTSIVVIENSPPSINQMTSTNPLCFGDCTGTVGVLASGTGPLTYLWNDASGSTVSQLTALCDGTYLVQVSDSVNCTTSDSISISSPTLLSMSMIAIDATGPCDGTATAIVSGGTPPYMFLWDDSTSQTSSTATGLCQGVYSVVVTDSNGCEMIDSVSVGGTNGLVENSALNLTIYPNPFSTEITIEIAETNEVIIAVVDITGKLVREFQFNEPKFQMDLSDLVSGVYFVRLQTNDQNGEIRLVKM